MFGCGKFAKLAELPWGKVVGLYHYHILLKCISKWDTSIATMAAKDKEDNVARRTLRNAKRSQCTVGLTALLATSKFKGQAFLILLKKLNCSMTSKYSKTIKYLTETRSSRKISRNQCSSLLEICHDWQIFDSWRWLNGKPTVGAWLDCSLDLFMKFSCFTSAWGL